MPAAAPSTIDDRPAGITCEKYVRGEGKRCRHYLANGGCELPDELMCAENPVADKPAVSKPTPKELLVYSVVGSWGILPVQVLGKGPIELT